MIRRQSLRLAGGLAATLLAGGGLLVYPAWRASRTVTSDIAAARRELGAITDRPAELVRQHTALTEIAAFATAYTKPMPPQSDVAGLIRGLTLYLDQLGVASREVATGASTRVGSVTVMPMTLTMRCDFPSAYAVISHVESLPRLIRVRRFKLAHEKAGEGPTDTTSPLKAEILLEVLSADEPAPLKEKMASPEKAGEP